MKNMMGKMKAEPKAVKGKFVPLEKDKQKMMPKTYGKKK